MHYFANGLTLFHSLYNRSCNIQEFSYYLGRAYRDSLQFLIICITELSADKVSFVLDDIIFMTEAKQLTQKYERPYFGSLLLFEVSIITKWCFLYFSEYSIVQQMSWWSDYIKQSYYTAIIIQSQIMKKLIAKFNNNNVKRHLF